MRFHMLYTITHNNFSIISEILKTIQSHKIMLVCGSSFEKLPLYTYLYSLLDSGAFTIVRFSDFTPNPDYSEAADGVRLFKRSGCDAILAAGGGSAIDVAKCIKAFSGMDNDISFLEQKKDPCDIPLIAVPTTAGTGSEVTKFAVIYHNGVKKSLEHESLLPDYAILDTAPLLTLPLYQKKATLLDALCHAMEFWWNIGSTDESRRYSTEAITKILSCYRNYLRGDESVYEDIIMASNLAGKAINITKTTAGHAMCYKLTTLYGLAHGHAAGLVNQVLFKWMVRNTDRITALDKRKKAELSFITLSKLFGTDDTLRASDIFSDFIDEIGLACPAASEADIPILTDSVNAERLANNPIALTQKDIEHLYRKILM
jgi:alcohol dehydrogenase class IV